MPIVAFSNCTDDLTPDQRNRGNFITNIKVDDNRLWIPYADGVCFQPCSFNLTSAEYSLVLKARPGAALGVHYHPGSVVAYTLQGCWRYLEYDWIAEPGTFVYEPPGEAHTLVALEGSSDPVLIFFTIKSGLLYMDSPDKGGFIGYDDAFTILQIARQYYRQAGLDVRELDKLIR